MNRLRLLSMILLLSSHLYYLPLWGFAFQTQRQSLSSQQMKQIFNNQPDFKAEILFLSEDKRVMEAICIANKGTKSRIKMNMPPLTSCLPGGDQLLPTDTTTLITEQGKPSILLFEQSKKYIRPDKISEEPDEEPATLGNMYTQMVNEIFLNDGTLRIRGWKN